MASPHYPNSVSPSLHQGQKRSTGVEREGLIRTIDLVRGKIRVAIRWHGSGSGLNLGDSNNSNVATQSSVAWQWQWQWHLSSIGASASALLKVIKKQFNE